MNRRELIKFFSVAQVGGALLNGIALPTAYGAPYSPSAPKRDLIKELGLRTFINAAGTYTAMTASLMHDEVIEAIKSSSKHFVMYNELQDKVGEKIAAICHAEAAMVTSGCWSALVLGTAAALTGMDKQKIALLPNVQSFDKNEVVVQKAHYHDYFHALTNTGIIPVQVETPEETEKAINSKTALMFFLNESAPMGKIQCEEWLALAKKYQVPAMIDIAADIPPVHNLWKHTDMGFDLVCISGGKAIRGPQSAGMLLGRKDLIAAARLSAPPNGNNIGRGMKVNKEEVLGMYAALERYVKQDHDKEWKQWEAQIALIQRAVEEIKGVSALVSVPPIANHTPTLSISWDSDLVKISRRELQQKLRNGKPSIEVIGKNGNAIQLTVFMLRPGEEKIVARRLREEFNRAVT